MIINALRVPLVLMQYLVQCTQPIVPTTLTPCATKSSFFHALSVQICAFVALLAFSLMPKLAWLCESLIVKSSFLLLLLTSSAVVAILAPALALFVLIRVSLGLWL